MKGVPRKPTLSPSKLTTYLACPAKYYWTYLRSEGKFYLRAKSYYSFGTTLHGVLQRFHDAGDVGVTTTAEAVAAYEESWIDAGYRSAEEMAEAFGEGREIVERYVEEIVRREPEAKTIMVERQLRKDYGDFFLLGRLDRVDEYPDGTVEVVDYKSGRSTVTTEEVESDIAMSCYQLLLRHRFPDRPVRARIVALRTGDSACASFTDEEAAEFEFSLTDLCRQVLNRDFFEIVPAYKSICSRCDFLPLCRKHEEFSEG